MNSKLSLFWGLFIFAVSAYFFNLSTNSFISVFYVFISIFCGMFLIAFRKDVPVFSPIFMLLSSIFVNIGFPALYILTNKLSFSEELLKNISIVYVIYFFALILPVFFANQIFAPSENKKISQFFSINLNQKNLSIYLLISNALLISLIVILLKETGFSYIEALKTPLDFRFAASAGNLSYLRKVLFIFFMLNSFILAKYKFTENSYQKENPFRLKTFIVIHIILLLAFAVISGSRSILFLPVLSAIAIYCIYNRLNIKTSIKIAAIFLITLCLMSCYSVYRNKNKIYFNNKEFNTINILSESVKRLDNFKNSLYFFEYIEQENGTIFYFKDFHIVEQIKNHFLQPFPRYFISDKGYYFSSLITEKVFNVDINNAKITYNFGGISNAFWNFGIAGVILEGLLLGTAVVWFHRRFLKFINNDGFFLLFMTTFFFIPNSIIVDGFWNTMDGCGYFLNLALTVFVIWILSLKVKFNS